MSLSETFQASDIELFAFMPEEVRELVLASLEPASYPFGTAIVREGDEPDALYIVVSGRARAVKLGEHGEEVTLNTFGPGDTFGEMGLLLGQPRAATVRASAPLETLRLDAAVFRGLVARNPKIRESLELDVRLRALREFFLLHTPFARLPRQALAVMLQGLVRVPVAAGEIIIREGDSPGPLYVVEDGRLRAYTHSDGQECDLAYYGKGDVFGERSLLSDRPRAASVQALSEAHLLSLPTDVFRSLLESRPDFREQIETWVAQYDYQRVARVPIDMASELLPADAEAPPPVSTEQLDADRGVEEPAARTRAPFATPDGRFVKRRTRIRKIPYIRQIDEADCGAACLTMVCRQFGRRVSLSRVRRAVSTSVEGTSLRGLARGAAALGLDARTVKASRRNLDQLPLPAIIHWQGNHWVVLFHVGPRDVRIADPALGLRRLPRGEFDEHWTGYAALFEPTQAFDRIPEAEPARRWLWPVFRPHRKAAIVAVVLALAVSALQMVQPIFIQTIVDEVLPQRDVSLLRLVMLALAGILVVMSVGSLAQRYLLSRAAVRVDGSTLDLLTGKLLALPLRYFYARRTGDIQRRLIGMRQIREFAVQQGVVALTAAAQLLAAVVLMTLYSRVLTAVFLAWVPVYVILMRLVMRRLRPLFQSLEEAFGEYSSRQVDAIKGIETVKALGAEDVVRAQMVDDFDRLAHRLFKTDFTNMMYEAGVQMITFASLAAFLWVGANQVLEGNLSVGEFVSFNAWVVLANGPIVVLLLLWDEMQLNNVLVNRLNDVFDEEPEQFAPTEPVLPVPALHGRVKLENLGFRYGGPESSPILQGISVDVAAGTTVAIVGRSGSGKTTLVKCLAGLLEPTEGRILFDGAELRTLDYRQLRRKVGFVLQDNYLFSDTIARNIGFGEEPDQNRVELAARIASAHDFISRLPFGYETKIGETGILLSGGQRQRVAIARAIYGNPPILVLDEATSSLDTESEKAVKDNLDRVLERTTTFVIAHRLSTVRNADVILVLERGQLVERGTHDELMARRGLYFYLTSQQLDL